MVDTGVGRVESLHADERTIAQVWVTAKEVCRCLLCTSGIQVDGRHDMKL